MTPSYAIEAIEAIEAEQEFYRAPPVYWYSVGMTSF